MNIKAHFLSKDEFAEKEISDDAPALVLLFLDEASGAEYGTVGWVMATSVKADITRFAPVVVSAPDSHNQAMPFVLVGTGNVGDLDDIVEYSREFAQDVMNIYGAVEALSLPRFRGELAWRMRERYNDVRKKAFGIELAILSFITGYPEIHRIKYNGEYHPCVNYAVLGGYDAEGSSTHSLRKTLLAELAALYEKRLPTKEEAVRGAIQLLEKYAKDNGEVIHSDFSIEVLARST